jgi:hypothetical protein
MTTADSPQFEDWVTAEAVRQSIAKAHDSGIRLGQQSARERLEHMLTQQGNLLANLNSYGLKPYDLTRFVELELIERVLDFATDLTNNLLFVYGINRRSTLNLVPIMRQILNARRIAVARLSQLQEINHTDGFIRRERENVSPFTVTRINNTSSSFRPNSFSELVVLAEVLNGDYSMNNDIGSHTLKYKFKWDCDGLATEANCVACNEYHDN